MKASDLMSNDFHTIAPEASISSVAKLMNERGTTSVVIVEGGAPVGIVTETDFVRRVLAMDRDPKVTKIRDIMSKPLVSIAPDISILDAIVLMKEKDFSQLPVIQNGKLVGIVRLNNLMRYLAGFFSAHRW